jgi:hypothetical protein
MITNMRNTTYQSLMSKPFGASDESCSLSKNGSLPDKHPTQETAISDSPPEIQTAQKLFAQIAVRIMTAKKREKDE